MRKTLEIFAAILVGLFILLSLADTRGEYAAEKALWKINKKFNKAVRDPRSYPDIYFAQLVSDYERFEKRFASTSLVPSARIYSGRIYMVRKDYPKARELFESVLHQYPDHRQLNLEALIAIERTYELEGDEKNALKTYKKIIRDYTPPDPKSIPAQQN